MNIQDAEQELETVVYQHEQDMGQLAAKVVSEIIAPFCDEHDVVFVHASGKMYFCDHDGKYLDEAKFPYIDAIFRLLGRSEGSYIEDYIRSGYDPRA